VSDTPFELPSNWQNDLYKLIVELDNKLHEAKNDMGKNPKVNEVYEDTLKSVAKARQDISGLIATFKKEYRSQTS
jgi:uncharacterized coiled-coil DUF342 family protein